MPTPRVDARNDLVCRDPSVNGLGSRFCQGARVRSGWSFPIPESAGRIPHLCMSEGAHRPGHGRAIGRVRARKRASGGSAASRVLRIAGDVIADSAPTSCRLDRLCPVRGKPALICSGAAGRRALPYGGSNSVLWGFNSAARSSGPVRGAAAAVRELPGQQRGCHRASLMINRREAAAAVRPGPAAPFRPAAFVVSAGHTPGRSGGPVLPPLSVCEMRARPALGVLACTGDGSPIW
jgi:hypothetical protein